jgi:hypothetical protein
MHGAGKQTDKIISADERMAAALENNVAQAGKALNATIDQSHLDQRAWVGADKINQFNFVAGPGFAVPFDVVNTGKTPALHLRSYTALKSLEKNTPFKPTYPEPRPPKASLTVLQPQMHMTLYTLPTDVSAKQFGDIQNGRGILYIYGRITYDDIFSKNHLTTFCVMYWAGLTGPISCDTYNDAN